jgi:hypothetical protein
VWSSPANSSSMISDRRFQSPPPNPAPSFG